MQLSGESASWSAWFARPGPVVASTRNLKLGPALGSGAFSTVYLALNCDTGQLMAVKKVRFAQDDPKAEERLDQLQSEVGILKQVKHANVVQYYFSVLEQEENASIVNLVMEYVAGGTLASLVNTFGALSELCVGVYTQCMVSALDYLHQMHIVHKDLSSNNVLVSSGGAIKIVDFGSASWASETKVGMVGTPRFLAPEVIRGEKHSPASDVWSLGCILLHLLTGAPPWANVISLDKPTAAVLLAVASATSRADLPLPSDISPISTSFLELCLALDPNSRPPCSSLLGHEFVDRTGSTVADGENTHVNCTSVSVVPTSIFFSFERD